jgi:hypothetical protein
MFDYQNATIEQMVEHIKKAKSALVSRMRQYHKNKGNEKVVKMIDIARERVKLEKVQQRMDELQND